MTTITDTLRQCHAIVWVARAELEHVWPTPTTEDALLFAFTELGESIDAALRTNGDYARNRDKSLDVLDELADCAMMLLTAMGNDWVVPHGLSPHEKYHDWHRYSYAMSLLLNDAHNDVLNIWDMAALVARIATHPGMDLPTRLTARLERIKAKRLGVGA